MEELETLVKNLQLILELIFTKNPYLTVVITASGNKIEIMASHYGLTQIINEPTNILEDDSSCIDLILTFRPNMVCIVGFNPHYI